MFELNSISNTKRISILIAGVVLCLVLIVSGYFKGQHKLKNVLLNDVSQVYQEAVVKKVIEPVLLVRQ